MVFFVRYPLCNFDFGDDETSFRFIVEPNFGVYSTVLQITANLIERLEEKFFGLNVYLPLWFLSCDCQMVDEVEACQTEPSRALARFKQRLTCTAYAVIAWYHSSRQHVPAEAWIV